jgi:hypothetical protein
VRAEVEANRYESVDAFLEDVRLVFTNCVEYHGANSNSGLKAQLVLHDLELDLEEAQEKTVKGKFKRKGEGQDLRLNSNELTRCEAILKELTRFYDEAFLEPVDPVKFNLLDYFATVPHIMCLKTVERKLKWPYRSVEDFVHDMRLIATNVYNYYGPSINQPGDDERNQQISLSMHETAQKFERDLNELVAQDRPRPKLLTAKSAPEVTSSPSTPRSLEAPPTGFVRELPLSSASFLSTPLPSESSSWSTSPPKPAAPAPTPAPAPASQRTLVPKIPRKKTEPREERVGGFQGGFQGGPQGVSQGGSQGGFQMGSRSPPPSNKSPPVGKKSPPKLTIRGVDEDKGEDLLEPVTKESSFPTLKSKEKKVKKEKKEDTSNAGPLLRDRLKWAQQATCTYTYTC